MAHGFMKFYSVSQEEVRHNPIKEQARNCVQGLTRHTVNYSRGPKEMERAYRMRGTQVRACIRADVEHLPWRVRAASSGFGGG